MNQILYEKVCLSPPGLTGVVAWINVIPAKAGIQRIFQQIIRKNLYNLALIYCFFWIPACAGMTMFFLDSRLRGNDIKGNSLSLAMTVVLSLTLCAFSLPALAVPKPKIVASITPIASIVAMLVHDEAEIITIATSSGCPHHYHLKPSDITKVKEADLAIYIDDQFDGFAAKLLSRHSKNIIKISDIKKLKLIENNWHIWLDLENVEIILQELALILKENFPQMRENINNNYLVSIKQINNLSKIKNTKLANLSDVILLDESAEYFFKGLAVKIQHLYSKQKSLKYITHIEELLSKSKSKYLILTSEMNDKIYQNLNAHIIILESENWQSIGDIKSLFFDKYLKMIDQLDF